MNLDKISGYQEALDSMRTHVRDSGISEGVAIYASVFAGNLRRALWKDDLKADAAALADKFDAIYECWLNRDSWDLKSVAADQVPAEVLA